MRRLMLFVLIILLVACHGSTDPASIGKLDSRITRGERQATRAGDWRADSVVDLVYRNPVTGAMINHRPKLWERVLLPPVAYALQAVGVQVQPNSVVCVQQPADLVPVVPCVNSDAFGNSKFSFVSTTKAGTHTAFITATYGLETTIPDTVTIVVEPGPADPNYRTPSLPMLSPGDALPDIAVVDAFGNAVAFRVVADKRLSVADTAVGSLGARTLTWSAPANDQEYVTELRGKDDVLVGRLGYRIGDNLRLTWRAVGVAVQIP